MSVSVKGSSIGTAPPDGKKWTAGTLTYPYGSICYGGNKFVQVFGFGLNPRNIYGPYSSTGLYSTDGVNWTEFNMPSEQIWEDVMYGNGRFVAITAMTSDGAKSRVLAYSDDGINWTQESSGLPASNYWIGGTYGKGYFVVFSHAFEGGGGYNDRIAYSTTGTSFTSKTIPVPQSAWIEDIAYGDGAFVAITSKGYVLRATDPSGTWTCVNTLYDALVDHPPASTSQYYTIVYGNGRFVASGYKVQAYSDDKGVTWTEVDATTHDLSTSLRPHGACFGNGKFVGTKGWTKTGDENNAYVSGGGFYGGYKIAFGNGIFVSSTGSNKRFVYSRTTNDY